MSAAMRSMRVGGLVRAVTRIPGYLRWRWHGSPEAGPVTGASWARTYGRIRPGRGRRQVVGVLVVVDASSSDDVARTHASLQVQTRAPSAVVTVDAGEVAIGIRALPVGRVVLIAAGDRLGPTAIEWFSSLETDVDLGYGDHLVTTGGDPRPVLKPSWSPRRQAHDGYVGTTVCMSAALASHVASTDPPDLAAAVAQATRAADSVAHLPVALWETGRADTPPVVEQSVPAAVTVTAIVPSRDRADLLGSLMPGLLERTRDVSLHVVLVDNGTVEPAAVELLTQLGDSPDVTVIRVDEPFNFSRLINVGARSGPPADHLLLLNNDIEVLDPGWLVRLCRWLEDPAVVAVGPELVFPDGTIQHAGMVLGLGGIAGHYALGETTVPPLGPPDVPREVSCLTGACLLVRSADFELLGGLDESLAVDFQDVDFCLRLRRDLGGTLMYDPIHPLQHRQMASRDPRDAGNPATIRRMRHKWGAVLDEPDPYWSPHLALVPPGGGLAEIPMRRRDRRRRVAPRISGG